MAEICIFPIPDCVTFPGTVFPLHVFEPRYRQMINHCLETGMPVAICHTQKELSPRKETQDLREALNSNQATYRPYPVFSAGPCLLKERLDDGRLIVDVNIQARYRLGEERQLLPYQIYECEVFNDRPLSEQEDAACTELRDKICHRLLALMPPDSAESKMVSAALTSDAWKLKGHSEFSFELFGLIRFRSDLLQNLLEMDSAQARLESTLGLLNA